MKRGKEFNNILDECLESLLVKGETLEQCLEKHPEYAAQLEPLLRTAVAASKALAIQPDTEFKARARYEFRLVLEKVKPKRVPFLIWQPRWAMAMVISLAVVVAGGGTVVAADDSMPGSPLYPVKLATEQVRVTLTPSDIGKAELYAALADRRVAEITYLVNKGRLQRVELAAQRLKKHLAKMNSLHLVAMTEKKAPGGPARARLMLQEQSETDSEMAGSRTHAVANRRARLRSLLGHFAADHPDRLHELLERAPESAKPALQRAIAISVASYNKALEDLD